MMQEQQEPSSEDDTDAPALDDEEVLCLSMELCYRSHLRRPRFKGSGHTVAANPGSDDDDELSQDLITSQSSQQFDEDFLWPDAALPIADNSDFDLLPLPAHNADVKPMTIQDPFDFWHDSDNEDEDLLDLSSSMPASSNSDTSSFATSITSFFGSDRQDYGEDALDWDEDSDVNMDHGACHRERSPDAPHLHTGPTLSPSAMFADDGSEPDLSFKTAFPGLSSKQCEAGDDDLELAFESDEEAHDPEGLERMVDASTCELEHQGSEIGTEDNCGVAEAKGLLEEDDWM
ncbi:hypothetical protein C8F01DRAFT_1114887 [Mycena amicta]|nr:hypothetical protein C8F01DRAFT_1114887 [Mycena amicta]